MDKKKLVINIYHNTEDGYNSYLLYSKSIEALVLKSFGTWVEVELMAGQIKDLGSEIEWRFNVTEEKMLEIQDLKRSVANVSIISSVPINDN